MNHATDLHDQPFAMDGSRILTAEEHFGIKGFALAAGVPHRDAASVRGLWAPPFAGPDFSLQVRLNGELVPTSAFWWNGNECRRSGTLGDLQVESSLVTPLSQRAVLLLLNVTNTGDLALAVPLQLAVRGGVSRVSFWEFSGPPNPDQGLPWAQRAGAWHRDADLLTKSTPEAELALATDLPMQPYHTFSGHWEAELILPPGGSQAIHIIAALGSPDEAAALCRSLRGAAARFVERARDEWAAQVREVFERLPRLEASDPRLEAFYNRSLVSLLLNQWRVPEFVTCPYYSTGAINGGCVCCYLWDFGEPWELLPLYDPPAVRDHILQFLSVDITRHFAWVPTTGEPFGPWYPVNQEKIIFLIYHYVMLTGDTGFLSKEVAGRSVLDWVLFHATYRDGPDLPVSLIDYGAGNNHLELRGALRYDHHVPDLNARRFTNYLAAHALAGLVGRETELAARARDLKALIRRLMWDPEARWFAHLDPNFAPDLRYTVQMFKLIGSNVLDDDQLAGLLSHLNDDEFLSAWGLHSMSKQDPAFDQEDIDNGGGGNYTAFTPQIIERLYKAGRADLAEDLLRRILWWGERLPYWGDSIAANHMDYRRDTPLQSTIGALAGAQSLIFGMFGLSVTPDGAITLNPCPPEFSPRIALRGLRLRGRCLDVVVEGDQYSITEGDQTLTAHVGAPTVLPPRP